MRCYGNVKGRKYYGIQPEFEQKAHFEKSICPTCRKPKRERDFWDGDIRRKTCIDCRIKSRQAQEKSRKKRSK